MPAGIIEINTEHDRALASQVARMMVSQQNDWGDDNRKRSREDEYEDIVIGGTLGFTEHRSVCTLPPCGVPILYRPLRTSSHHLFPVIRNCHIFPLLETVSMERTVKVLPTSSSPAGRSEAIDC